MDVGFRDAFVRDRIAASRAASPRAQAYVGRRGTTTVPMVT